MTSIRLSSVTFGACAVLSFASVAFAGGTHEHPVPQMPTDFEKVKQLVGTWEGTGKMGGKEQHVTVSYELSSGGTVVIERLFAGQPHEMVSVYHKEGNGLAMTHYCSVGNHPTMMMTSATDGKMSFEADKAETKRLGDEFFMNSLTLTMADKNHIKQEWTSFAHGKSAGEPAVFEFTRK